MKLIVCKIFLYLFMFLLTTKLVKNSDISARIFFIFLKNVFKQTGNSFNTNFQPQWKDQKSSYQVRQSLGLFCHLILHQKVSKALQLPKSQRNYVWKGLVQVKIKKKFSEIRTHKISETLLSCKIAQHAENSIFQEFSSSINKTFI